MSKISLSTTTGNGYTRSYDLLDKCIHCGITMSPNVIHVTEPNLYNRIAITLQCTSPTCSKFMVQEFVAVSYESSNRVNYNYAPSIDNVPDILKAKFPEFYAAYTEAREVESDGHMRSAGMSYRFSLETLIKDYAKSRWPDKSDNIDSLMMGSIIKNYFNSADDPLHHLFTASAWLGNDQTHTIPKHPDKGLNEFKEFLQATQFIIAGQLHSELAQKFIEEGN
ncbi:hypothetical protein KQH86_05570 [Weissella confusa]|uniref:hypothetical protein n=1 Tax=Weissella TaxID=46255 RepID=UPI0011929969|nr:MULTISPECIES: hypothetical protein [Weissella]MBU5285559.1 hypothetical protein [Weissella confusa]TVV40435.1 hypothetical protein FO438_04620 [Weissella cibaria]